MRMADVTFTVQVKKRIAIPSALSYEEIRQAAYRGSSQILAQAELLKALSNNPPAQVDASFFVSTEEGLGGPAADFGVKVEGPENKVVFGEWEDPETVDSDQRFEDLTGRPPPAKPAQMNMFNKG